jgi:LPS-assembly lipoprotein
VTSGTTELLDRNHVRLTRDYGYDESAVLAKEHEEEFLRVSLAGEIADLILRRLAAL